MLKQIDDLDGPADCAQHCQDIEGCVYFSFFTSDGHCNLCDTNAAKSSGGDTYVLSNDTYKHFNFQF